MATVDELRSFEQAQDDLLVQRKLAEAMHVSLAGVKNEPIPHQIALLLLQVGMAELIKSDLW